MFPIKVLVLLSVCNLHFILSVVLGTWGAYWRSHRCLLELKSSRCVSGCATWNHHVGSCVGKPGLGDPPSKKWTGITNPVLVLMLEGKMLPRTWLFLPVVVLLERGLSKPWVTLPWGAHVCSVWPPTHQPHCSVAKSLISVCVIPDFVSLGISCLDTPVALLDTANEAFRPQGGCMCWLFKINFSTSALKANFYAFGLPCFPS